MPGPIAGAGIGLRDPHLRTIDEQRPRIAWLEAHSENLFGDDPRRHRRMERLRAHYPLSLHGVGLSVGSAEPLDADHLHQLAEVVRRYEPSLVSEHACWGAYGGHHSNQLLPLPRTREALDILCDRVSQLQECLQRPVALEPVARYLEFRQADMSEPEFLTGLTRRSGCSLLIDLSNLHINSRNQGTDPYAWLDAIPAASVAEYHLAGFDDCDGVLIDTHDREVAAEVWRLYAAALQKIGPRPTLIEWDSDIPPLAVLLQEMDKADAQLHGHAMGKPQ